MLVCQDLSLLSTSVMPPIWGVIRLLPLRHDDDEAFVLSVGQSPLYAILQCVN